METAVELQILRNKGQKVGVLGRLRNPPEAFIEIVVVVKENAASVGGQLISRSDCAVAAATAALVSLSPGLISGPTTLSSTFPNGSTT